MELQTSSGMTLANPTPTQIMAALATLPGGDESFAILSVASETYVQVAGSDAEGFVLEYRDGSEDRHFQAVQALVPLGVVQDVFERYARGDDSWRSRVVWELLGTPKRSSATVSRPQASVPPWIVLAVALVLAAVGVAAYMQ